VLTNLTSYFTLKIGVWYHKVNQKEVWNMKRVGMGAIMGLALFAAPNLVGALPQQNQVVIPYFSSARGMFTALTYVYDDTTTGNQAIHFTYYYKTDLTQNVNLWCEHFDGYRATTHADLDTIIIDGNMPETKDDVFDGEVGGIAPPVQAEGFVALTGDGNMDGTPDDNLVAEAHVVITAARGVMAFRALQVDAADSTFINGDTLQPGENTTVMFFPENITETYVYMIADGVPLNSLTSYNQVALINLLHSPDRTNALVGVFNRSELGRSAGGLRQFNCAAVVHIRDILGEAAYNWVMGTGAGGGWFSLETDVASPVGIVPYKIEISSNFGATVVPLVNKTYAR